MAQGSRRRWLIGGIVFLVVAGALGGSVAMRLAKKDDGGGKAAPVTLEFTPADLTRVEARPLARWLPVSGALQPVRQATVKAKVSGDVKQVTVREGETVQAGQALARIDTADLDAKLIERIGALESAKAQLAMAEKTRASNQMLLKQSFISQNAFDNSESSFRVAEGSVKSAEAQVQLAKNALRDAVAVSPLTGLVGKRHVQPGEKVAFDSPLVTVVDLKDMELQAAVPAVDVPEVTLGMPVELVIDGFGERRFKGRVERINPATEPGTRSILVYVGIPNTDGALRGGMFATGRIALAASAPVPTLPATAIRVEAGQAYVWLLEDGKLVKRMVATGARDDTAGRVEVRTALPAGAPILGARMDNLKEGAPAIVKAPLPTPVPASAPTSSTTQVAG
ncbi:MAG TPA: efflux RND transporter periplasmic adaptor subunit [Casimicrobiaceae bacterium]|nr:efflux RND transporter periplasmic adaptor subunit [Casimicrobiaceae bacterium]